MEVAKYAVVASEEDERSELCPDSRAPFPPIQRDRLRVTNFTSIELAAWVVADLI